MLIHFIIHFVFPSNVNRQQRVQKHGREEALSPFVCVICINTKMNIFSLKRLGQETGRLAHTCMLQHYQMFQEPTCPQNWKKINNKTPEVVIYQRQILEKEIVPKVLGALHCIVSFVSFGNTFVLCNVFLQSIHILHFFLGDISSPYHLAATSTKWELSPICLSYRE